MLGQNQHAERVYTLANEKSGPASSPIAASWRRCLTKHGLAPEVARPPVQLTDAEFRECDLTRARLIGVVMQDAVIDGLVTNLVVNGVEVMPYVEAELDRRHPVRLLIRSADPADLLGTDPPPLENVPNRSGEDPHGLPRSTLEEQQMVSDFLRPNAQSQITDTCTGTAGPACHDRTFGGTASP